MSLSRPRRDQGRVLFDDHLFELHRLGEALGLKLPVSTDLLDYLPPVGQASPLVRDLWERCRRLSAEEKLRWRTPIESIHLEVPISQPRKIILLVGNYTAHIVEGGGQAPERREAFPYFF